MPVALAGGGGGPDVVLTGLVRDFRSAHEDMDVVPADGKGHYAGNVSQVIGSDGAPLQVHGVSDFDIIFGTLIPGVPYAARATVLGAEIVSAGYPCPVTLTCETDTQVFQPFGLYNDPAGPGDVNDNANPRHFIFSLTDVYDAETPISITATSWIPTFDVDNFGFETEFTSSSDNAQKDSVATRVTMPEDGTVTSMSAYIDRDSGDDGDVRFAIYTDAGGKPGTLLVESGRGDQSSGWGWETVGLPDTYLTAGTYWLALSLDDDGSSQEYAFDNHGGATHRISDNSVDNGFPSSWGTSADTWDDRVSIYATYTSETPSYSPYITARSGDNSPQVKVLKDGDAVPSIPAFQDQTNLAVFVAPYVDVNTGLVTLRDNEAIYLFELGTTDMSKPSADFQDLVMMVTLATDPVYFYSPDTIAEGTNPIGYKVNQEWQDIDGNNIAPHLFDPTLGDAVGESGVTSSGGVYSPATFYEWFRDTLGTNMAIEHSITLTDDGSGVWEYSRSQFYPINGMLFGNEGGGKNDNFTYAVQMMFEYHEGTDQWVEFKGGDGCWIFINGFLAIDLGGVDVNKSQRIYADRLNLVDGQTYMMALFYANRQSNKQFDLKTNVFLTPGPIPGTVSGTFD